MADCNSIDVGSLLGRSIVLSEAVHGFLFERRGVVTGVLRTLPSSGESEAILLEEPGRDPEFYAVGSFDLLYAQ